VCVGFFVFFLGGGVINVFFSSEKWLESPEMARKSKIYLRFNDCLSRQVSEGVHIRRGGPEILNSKSVSLTCL
jgi:hypothetical protein